MIETHVLVDSVDHTVTTVFSFQHWKYNEKNFIISYIKAFEVFVVA